MQLYRFSPITTQAGLLDAIKHIHVSAHQLSENTFGKYLEKSGNVGVFTHYEDEYEYLTKLRKELTDESVSFNGKYFKLKDPIVLPEIDGIPETTYEFLYIRQPDPYRSQVGDIDFCVSESEYEAVKESVKNAEAEGARVYEGKSGLDMVELFNPDVDVLAYVVDHKMAEVVK